MGLRVLSSMLPAYRRDLANIDVSSMSLDELELLTGHLRRHRDVLLEACGMIRCALMFRKMQSTTKNAPALTTPTIYYHGGQSYSVGSGPPIVVGDEEHAVLNAFRLNPRAMTRTELETKMQGANAPRVTGQLATRYDGLFASAVRRPGRRGNGGYYAHVIDATK